MTAFTRDRHRPSRRALPLAAAMGLAIAAWPGAAAASPALATVVAWVIGSGDNHGEPFAIVDKVDAEVSVFAADGTPRGSSVVLLGLARGDRSAPGIGTRPLAQISPAERTTPAGRFDAEIGTDTAGHTVLWVDYADAIALHAVVTSNPREHRLQRLASPMTADRRISYGCINVPPGFFSGTVEPAFRGGGVVYVLPEERSLKDVFGIADARGTLPAGSR